MVLRCENFFAKILLELTQLISKIKYYIRSGQYVVVKIIFLAIEDLILLILQFKCISPNIL